VKVEETVSSVVAKASELNQEYSLTTALKDLLGKAGDLSIEAVDAAIKFADDNDLKGKIAAKFEEIKTSSD
jgi:hypothetical protein